MTLCDRMSRTLLLVDSLPLKAVVITFILDGVITVTSNILIDAASINQSVVQVLNLHIYGF